MERFNGVDALLLYLETPGVHMHTLKIGVLDISKVPGGLDFGQIRELLDQRLGALAPFRRQLVETPWKMHHPVWLDNVEIDLNYHVRRAVVAEPGGRRELDDLIGEIAASPLDRSRPLWEMHVAEGLAGGRVAVIGKVHHVLADGVASANILAIALGIREPGDAGLATGTGSHPPKRQLLASAAREHATQIGGLPRLFGSTVGGVSRVRRRSRERGAHPDLARNFSPPATFLNHIVMPGRRFATAPLALSDVKSTAKHLGVTINDVVLAVSAGALRELLLRYDGHADRPLIAGVPVSYDASPDRITGNEFSYMTPSLPVHIADPLERLRLAALSADVAKENYRLLGPKLTASWLEYLPPLVAPRTFRWHAGRGGSGGFMNLTISNVPGPRERAEIAGATVSEFYSVGPLAPGSGMNITVWSYAGQFAISVLTDDRSLADAHEATDAMIRAFTELRIAAGLSRELTSVGTAMPAAPAVG